MPFVNVRRVSAAYVSQPPVLQRLAGKPPQTHSVLRDVSFGLGLGAQALLFGSPGSGKSTLLKLLTGMIKPTGGKVYIDSRSPEKNPRLAAGYVSCFESEPADESVHDALYSFGQTHGIEKIAARLGDVAHQLDFESLLERDIGRLSTTEALRINLARAALVGAPLLMLDDVAELLGTAELKRILATVFPGRTVIAATNQPQVAEALDWPLLLLHDATLSTYGTREEMAVALNCPRVVDVWVEGLRYDLMRQLKSHAGVLTVRLLTTTQFAGQRLRLTVRSSRYLPSLYDVLSRVELVRVEEVPVPLSQILSRLNRADNGG